MSETSSTTDRRSFLKTGALAAAPLAAFAPVAALADDGSKAKLARLEDERAIEGLHRAFLRQPSTLGHDIRAVRQDHDATIEIAEDGRTATSRCQCCVERDTAFTGDTTVERMARFQGHGSHSHAEERVLIADYVKGTDGWSMERVKFA
jgi:hypothetical protein